MKRARKVSNFYREVHLKQKQRLTTSFTQNTLPHRKQSCKVAEDIYIYTYIYIYICRYMIYIYIYIYKTYIYLSCYKYISKLGIKKYY